MPRFAAERKAIAKAITNSPVSMRIILFTVFKIPLPYMYILTAVHK